jgi:hypothetical protein
MTGEWGDAAPSRECRPTAICGVWGGAEIVGYKGAMNTAPASLRTLSSDELASRMQRLASAERATLVEFLLHLGEVDRRKLFAERGHSSLFVYLTDELRLAKACAYRRCVAARLLGRFPAIAAYLRDGRLCLTTLVELRDVLDDDNHADLLARAAGRTEDQVRELVAGLRAQAAPPDLLSAIPPAPAAATEAARSPPPAPPPPRPPLPPPRLQPISDELRVLRLTVGRDFVAELEQVRNALGHIVPDGNLESILRHCFRVTLGAVRKRRRGGDRRGPARAVDPASRTIPAEVRRAVWDRDGGACAFVAASGKRCGSTRRLELHHLVPHARGGASTIDNLSLRCSTHNLYHAELDFGPQHIARARAAR